MANLPATMGEAREYQALALARHAVACGKEGDFMNTGLPPFHPHGGRTFLRQCMKRLAINPFGMSDLVECADAGFEDADIALREMIAELANRGETLPAVLVAYNIKLLNPHRVVAPKPRGRNRLTNFLKDCYIMSIITEIIHQFGLRPTRHQFGRKRRARACSIVAIALAEAGMGRGGERAVQRIWERYAPSVVPGSTTEDILINQ